MIRGCKLRVGEIAPRDRQVSRRSSTLITQKGNKHINRTSIELYWRMKRVQLEWIRSSRNWYDDFWILVLNLASKTRKKNSSCSSKLFPSLNTVLLCVENIIFHFFFFITSNTILQIVHPYDINNAEK